MDRFRFLRIAAILLAMVLAAPLAAAAEPVRIGVLLPLSGPLSALGTEAFRGVEMAAQEMGASGARGYTFDLRVGDTGGTSEGGRDASRRLIEQDRVQVMAGGLSSPSAWAISAIAEADKVPMLIFGAATDALNGASGQYVYRLNPPVRRKLETLKAFLDRYAGETRSAAIVCENRPPALALSQRWINTASALGIDPVYRVLFEPGRVDYRRALAKVRAKKPDLILILGNPSDAALMMRQSRDLNLTAKLFLGEAPGFSWPSFAVESGTFGGYVTALVPWAATARWPGAAEFGRRYTERFGEPPGYAGAMAYAAMTVIADAMERTFSPTRTAVRDALARTDTVTVCGPVRFNPAGPEPKQNPAPWLLVQWQSGTLETIWPRHLASAEPKVPFPSWRGRIPGEGAPVSPASAQ